MITLKNRTASQYSDLVSITFNQVNSTSAEIDREVFADIVQIFHIPPYYYSNPYINAFGGTIKSLTPSVATAAEDGVVTRHSQGVADFQVEVNRAKLLYSFDLRDVANSGAIYEVLGITDGCLVNYLSDQIDSLLDPSYTMAANGRLFSTQDHTGQNYVRNPNFWGASLASEFTCCSPWNSNAGHRKAGTLITPQHIVLAAHYEFPKGTTVRFVAEDGTVYNRTAIGKERHPSYRPYYPDFTIYTLDSPLPSDIKPCKIFPSNFEDYMPESNLRNTRPAAVGLDQEEKGLIIDLYRDGRFATPTDSNRLIFYEGKIAGDSGNPAFVMFNGEFCLVTVWTWGGAGAGTAAEDYIADFNQMIIDADADAGITSTGYTVTEADFSAYPNFTTKNYIIEDNDVANGNASLWVEYGMEGGKMAYRMNERHGDYSQGKFYHLYWNNNQWIIDAWDDSNASTLATSSDDTSTPVGATFDNGFTFSNPA